MSGLSIFVIFGELLVLPPMPVYLYLIIDLEGLATYAERPFTLRAANSLV